MKILDAGVVVELLVGGLSPLIDLGTESHEAEEWAAPHLLDSEVLQVLRHLVRRGVLTDSAGREAMTSFTRMVLVRYPAVNLRARMWELRHNLSAYDATYVALTESIGATELLTTDARLAAAAPASCPVRVA